VEFNVPFQRKYGYIRDDVNHRKMQLYRHILVDGGFFILRPDLTPC